MPMIRGEERLRPTFQMQARQDVVGWLSTKDATESGVATTAAMELLRGVACELNEALNLGLAVPQQCMCACYGASTITIAVGRTVFCVLAGLFVCQRATVRTTSRTVIMSVWMHTVKWTATTRVRSRPFCTHPT